MCQYWVQQIGLKWTLGSSVPINFLWYEKY
jgi:hypothetical protein